MSLLIYPRSFPVPVPSLNTLGSFIFYIVLRTNTDRQTDKQTDSKILPTPTDIVGVGNKVYEPVFLYGLTRRKQDPVDRNGLAQKNTGSL